MQTVSHASPIAGGNCHRIVQPGNVTDLTGFRIYQDAVELAGRLHIPRAQAVHAIGAARREGLTGNHVICQMSDALQREGGAA